MLIKKTAIALLTHISLMCVLVISGCGSTAQEQQQQQAILQAQEEKEIYKEQAEQTNQLLEIRRLEVEPPPTALVTPQSSDYQQRLINHFTQPVAMPSNISTATDGTNTSTVTTTSPPSDDQDVIPEDDVVFLIQLTASADDLADRYNRLIQYTNNLLQTVEAANNVRVSTVQTTTTP